MNNIILGGFFLEKRINGNALSRKITRAVHNIAMNTSVKFAIGVSSFYAAFRSNFLMFSY